MLGLVVQIMSLAAQNGNIVKVCIVPLMFEPSVQGSNKVVEG